MSHMPRFWREKSFIGWHNFLLKYFDNQKTLWSLPELADHFEPNDAKERLKVFKNLSFQLSTMSKKGEVSAIKIGKTNHYGSIEITRSEEKKQEALSLVEMRKKQRRSVVVPKVSEKKLSQPIPESEVPKERKLIPVSDLTLTPRSEFYKKRVEEIINVVFKSFDLGRKIPADWIDEYNDLIDHIGGKKK